MEKSTGIESSIEVKPSFGLDDKQISQMIKDSMHNAADDIQARMLKEQQVEASRVIESVQAALIADSKLLNPEEVLVIENTIKSLAHVTQTDDIDAIENALKTLNDSTAIFAERRMDSSISQALAGQAVDKI
jgi:molecular chaperone HscA